jgi:ADP-ribosylglycohydrolase
MNRDDLLRRARGALLGVAIGDAMGAPVEGRSAAEIRAQYGHVTGFFNDTAVGTDDTDFTLFNAYLLATYGPSITLTQVEHEWRDKLLSGRYFYRPGGFSDVVSTRNLQARLHAPHSGRFNHQMWSDGVAMAISPAGIVAAGRPALAAQLAVTLGSVSNAGDGVYAAQAVAAAIAVAMTDASLDTMIEAAFAHIPTDSWTVRALRRAIGVAQGHAGLDDALDGLTAEVVVPWWPWADLVTEAVPLAFGVFLATQGDVHRAIPAAASLGRDADTIAAIVGSLAGAYSGEDAIPAAWRERALLAPGKCIGFVADTRLDDIAARLIDMALA